jgi:acyl-CoA thioester hydrolase
LKNPFNVENQASGSQYSLEFRVRDYECDVQGIVNNANYQHYLEHARHEFLLSKGISFYELHEQGLDLIVTKAEIEYKFPLKSRDRFEVKVNVRKEGNVRIAFLQEIYRIPDGKLIVRARITGAAIKNGRPVFPGNELLAKLGLE